MRTVIGFQMIISEDHLGAGETFYLGSFQNVLEGIDESRIVGCHEENQRRDENRRIENLWALVALAKMAALGVVSFVHDFVVQLISHLDPLESVWAR